jgi:hypothetical protein
VAEDDPDLLLAKRTLEWLRRQASPISLRDMYRNGPAAIRSVKAAGKIMALLEEHGHVRREPNQAAWAIIS